MDTGRLWRLTRNDYGRTLHEALAKRGVKLSLLYVYTRSLRDNGGATEASLGEEITIATRRGSEFDATEEFENPAPTDTVVFAQDNGTIVGAVFCSVSRPVYVDVIETEVGNEADTAYIWQLHVNEDYRRRGIATALIERACLVAAQSAGPTTTTALVAVDNTPSQTLFETTSFRRSALVVYGRLFGWTHRLRWNLTDATR